MEKYLIRDSNGNPFAVIRYNSLRGLFYIGGPRNQMREVADDIHWAFKVKLVESKTEGRWRFAKKMSPHLWRQGVLRLKTLYILEPVRCSRRMAR